MLLIGITRGRSRRHACRFLAPLALGLTQLASTGCTVVGYAIGAGTTPAPQPVSPGGIQAIPAGTDVEVFYLPEPCAAGPASGAPRPQPTCEVRVANGAYQGVEGDQLVLQTERLDTRSSVDMYNSGAVAPREVVRFTVPLDHVRLIRTKPSSAPAVVGAVVGAAVDLVTIVAVGNLLSKVH